MENNYKQTAEITNLNSYITHPDQSIAHTCLEKDLSSYFESTSNWATKVASQQAMLGAEGTEEGQGREAYEIQRPCLGR